MKKTWVVLPDAPQIFYEENPELPKVAANLLYNRNIRTQKEMDEFLNPDYSKNVHDPFLFNDMTKAVDRIFLAIDKNEKIVIHGDYDADGVAASIILKSMFNVFGYENVDVFLPHRETDGYGLNEHTVDILKKEGTNLLITCDCGISNAKEIESANKAKIDVIITDHHSVPEKMPDAFAIIHPKHPKEKYPDKDLSGGAVAFKLVQACLLRHKQTNSALQNGELHEGFEKWQLDMVALSLIADMVPLIGESRTLAKYGLIVLNKTRRIGLQKLLLEARLMNEDGTLSQKIDSEMVGFRIAPRINAAGRMNHANSAYKLLITNDPIEAVDLAFELNKNNNDRQKKTDELVSRAAEQAEKQTDSVIFVFAKEWPTGLLGLIAGKIKDKFQKPCFVITENNEGLVGSGRSVDEFNIIESIQELSKYLLKFGGHPMACGFTLKNIEIYEEFKKGLQQKFLEKTKNADISPKLYIDAEMSLEDVTWELYDMLEKFKPFGQCNNKPKFVAKGITVISTESVGKDKKHGRIMVTHKTPRIRKTIGWDICNNNNGVNWCSILKKGDVIDMVFEISLNEWNGNRELQITIVDLQKTI
jgi:single-stranded-DNA-specific exonuclease